MQIFLSFSFISTTRRYSCYLVAPAHLYHKPSIFPDTLSTASFNLKDSFTTMSFSSSLHSTMNVAVSVTNPICISFVISRNRNERQFFCPIPISFPPWERHRVSEQANAKRRTRGSSERVCMRIFMLMILSRVSSVMVSNNAPKHSCSKGFPSAKFNLIQTSTWPVKTVDTCRSLSSRQNANFFFNQGREKTNQNTHYRHRSSRLS
jgi:hypothetical protein